MDGPFTALVTAGASREPLDDVRVLTNLSTGRLGAALAGALAAWGGHVTLVAGLELASRVEWIDARVRVVPFGSFADLASVLEVETQSAPDLLFMAAAVADYSPVRTDGKIRSDAEELTVVLRRNPKLLTGLRARVGAGTLLVGFKLLAGASDPELVAAARRQLESCDLDLTVANDTTRMSAEEHRLLVVSRAEAPPVEFLGTKTTVATALADLAVTRWKTRKGGGHST